MKLLTGLTVILPTIITLMTAYTLLRNWNPVRRLWLGVTFMFIALLSGTGLLLMIPPGSLSAVPPHLRQSVDHIFTMAIMPLAAMFIFSLMTIAGGLRGLVARRRAARAWKAGQLDKS